MDEIVTQHLQTYARRHNLRLAERLGHGIHGIVYAAERKTAEKRDQFEARWSKVQAVLNALEDLDIYMVDVSPSNIAFTD